MPSKLLTKSSFVYGLPCPRYLWLLVNDKDKLPKAGAALQHRFDQGHLIGELAKQLFPDGISIPTEDFMETITTKSNAIQRYRSKLR